MDDVAYAVIAFVCITVAAWVAAAIATAAAARAQLAKARADALGAPGDAALGMINPMFVKGRPAAAVALGDEGSAVRELLSPVAAPATEAPDTPGALKDAKGAGGVCVCVFLCVCVCVC